MSQITVALGSRSYPIEIGTGLLSAGGLLSELVAGRDILIVTNETVAPLYLRAVREACGTANRTQATVLPDGESFKTLDTLNSVFTDLLENRFNRDAVLVALGGGVIGDVAGFAAAAYQRGVDFIQIPTTLLAQVDSSVGGKTAVNHALGKNMIGAFHQPIGVLSDVSTLDTLAPRELSAGLAEVVKYGLICDPDFFFWLEANSQALLNRDGEALDYAITRSCQIKAEVVSADERETGQRALLNLGHTFGHAIETGVGYGTWLHGEAVAAGMCMAADLSHRLGWFTGQDLERTQRLIQNLSLPTQAPDSLTPLQMRELMSVDKKVTAGKLRLVLLRAIGESLVTEDFEIEALNETLESCRGVDAIRRD